MRHRPRLYPNLWAVLFAMLGACQGSPTEPTPAHGEFIQPSIYCESVGVDLECDFWIFGDGGLLTDQATWSVSDTSLARVSSDGYVTTLRRGEVAITAAVRFRSATWWARVDPSSAPAQLLSIQGQVTNGRTRASIEGATVEIVEGYGAGRWGRSKSNGFYRIDRAVLEEIRKIRAYKTGFQPVVFDFTTRAPDSHILNVTLKPIAN